MMFIVYVNDAFVMNAKQRYIKNIKMIPDTYFTRICKCLLKTTRPV